MSVDIALELGGVPVVYLVLIGGVAIAGKRRGLGVSVALFALTAATGWWAIMQSRSSTAAIGVIFLPLVAGAAGLLGLAYGRSRSSTDRPTRVLGTLCLLAGLALPVSATVGGWRTIALN